MSAHKESFGRVIRERRRKIDLTQQQVARRIATSTPYVGHLEADKRHPSDEVVRRLADILGFDRRELFFLANPKAKALLHPSTHERGGSAWEEFSRDTRLHRIHSISGQELKMLEQVALLGEVRSSRDFIFVLNTVRHALRG
ncbi:MAG TPA: helix-turn-helix transcriptional regulator [Candidatus Binataceae bacterium]|nr:helix-turn-helix transcriptional regulator [Candidatus Binataceae bacterium]